MKKLIIEVTDEQYALFMEHGSKGTEMDINSECIPSISFEVGGEPFNCVMEVDNTAGKLYLGDIDWYWEHSREKESR